MIRRTISPAPARRLLRAVASLAEVRKDKPAPDLGEAVFLHARALAAVYERTQDPADKQGALALLERLVKIEPRYETLAGKIREML